MRRDFIINGAYILCFIVLNIGLLGIFALDGPTIWDVFDRYEFLFVFLWMIITIPYNIYVIKSTVSNKSTIYQIIVVIVLPFLILLNWTWQATFYSNYTDSTFLMFHPGLILSIFLYILYSFYSVYLIFYKLKTDMFNYGNLST